MSAFKRILISFMALLAFGLFFFIMDKYMELKPGFTYIYVNKRIIPIKIGHGIDIPKLTPKQKAGLIEMTIANNNSTNNKLLLKVVNEELSKANTEK